MDLFLEVGAKEKQEEHFYPEIRRMKTQRQRLKPHSADEEAKHVNIEISV